MLAVGTAVAALALDAASAAAGPFGGLVGVWGGNGIVTYASGNKERLRCRVQYTSTDGERLSQALKCASDSYNFQINAYYIHQNGAISGHWEEKVNQISGSIDGTATEGKIDGTLSGPGFKAMVRVDTKGNQQTVSITSPGQEIREVAIDVRRAGG
jgi:hypothetical protein